MVVVSHDLAIKESFKRFGTDRFYYRAYFLAIMQNLKSVSFTACGHPNITATHLTTLEFTKDKEVSKRGDCFVGVEADFHMDDLKLIAASSSVVKITLTVGSNSEVVTAVPNPQFKSDHELVIRRGPFASDRTFATHADRACVDFSRKFVEMLKDPKTIIQVRIERIE